MYPSRTAHSAGAPLLVSHADRSLPSNRTTASDGTGAGGPAGPGSTTGGSGRDSSCTAHFCISAMRVFTCAAPPAPIATVPATASTASVAVFTGPPVGQVVKQ